MVRSQNLTEPTGEGQARPKILLIEDERRVSEFVRLGLTMEGYQVEAEPTAGAGLRRLLLQQPDVVILDLMLPDIDGFEVCRRLREATQIPILILSARDGVSDRVRGLRLGADDYLIKPFSFDELLARIEALLRRADPTAAQCLSYADLEMDLGTREVRRRRRPIVLTSTEFQLLEFFLRHPQQVLSHGQLLSAVWGYDFGGSSDVLRVYVGYLRRKTEAHREPRLVQTVRGVGYVLKEG